MVRLVTRLAHSRSNVTMRPPAPQRAERLPAPDPSDWTLVPLNARRRFRRLLDLQPALREWADRSPANDFALAGRRGVIASGIAVNYVREVLGHNHDISLLKISTYPLPLTLVRALVDHCDEITVIEDGYPYIESRLNGLLGLPGKAVRGKLSGHVRLDGELTPDSVAHALGRAYSVPVAAVGDLSNRPPALCKGCPHADTFKAMLDATVGYAEPILFSDIGCYTLGFLPPFKAVHSCVDMGSSIAMAHGAAQAGAFPVLCTIGDSTFTHSGMTPLIGAAKSNADMTVFVLDNAIVGMTGGQETLATGEELVALLRGLGVAPEHLHVLEPLPRSHQHNVELIAKEVSYRGLSVFVARRACIQIKRKGSAAPHAAEPSKSAALPQANEATCTVGGT